MPPYKPPTPEKVELVEEIDAVEEIDIPEHEPQEDEEMDEEYMEMEEIMLDELGDYDDEDLESRGGSASNEPISHHETMPQDMAAETFKKHSKPVFACALLAKYNIAITGGEDDCAYVWDTNTLEIIHEINGHKDTVHEIHFNHDNSYLATGDMSGQIFVLKVRANDSEHSFEEVFQFAMGDMLWMRWHPYANVLAAGSKEGEVYVWRIPSGDCKILPGNAVSCNSADWSHDGKLLFAGYSNGDVRLWDLKPCTVVWEVTESHPLSHKIAVQVIACDKESPFYASGDESGKIIFHAGNGPVGCIDANAFIECMSIAPSPEFRMIAIGTLNGELTIWDYSKCTMRTLCKNPVEGDTITGIKWIDPFTVIASTCMGYIHGFDARSGDLKFTLSGHLADIYGMSYDVETRALLTASEDWTAKLFHIP